MLKHPLIFHPLYKSVIWGGTAISRLKGIDLPQTDVGESWEISAVPGRESVVADGPLAGRKLTDLVREYGAALIGTEVMERTRGEFPLLVKLLDAGRDLSLQVHPDDEIARRHHGCQGKAEMWYVIDALPGASIYSGFSRPFSADDYRRCVADGTIMNAIACHKSAAGQFYYIPAGTVHTLTGGNLVVEIQQSSDITYRIYDYDRLDNDGRPRSLHIDEAARAIDYTYPFPGSPTAHIYPGSTRGAVTCDYFTVDYIKGATRTSVELDGTTFAIVIAVTGAAMIISADGTRTRLGRGSTALIPASAGDFGLETEADALVVKSPSHTAHR